MKQSKLSAVLVLLFVLFFAETVFSGTLKDVKKKGYIKVGVNGDLFGFGKPDAKGVWQGLDVDTGRAVAAGIHRDTSRLGQLRCRQR